MKVSILRLLFLQMLLMSCHRTATTTRLSCCSRDNAVATPSLLAGSVTNASIYQLAGQWTDQHSRVFSLNELKGKIQLVAMVFTHCGYACPHIIEDMKAIRDSLPASERDKVDYVLVSFDPERDTPRELGQFAVREQLDAHWELLHGSADQIRELSMLLDVKYQKLSDGNFAHSNAIVVLNKEGDVVRHYDGLGENTSMAVTTIHELLNQY